MPPHASFHPSQSAPAGPPKKRNGCDDIQQKRCLFKFEFEVVWLWLGIQHNNLIWSAVSSWFIHSFIYLFIYLPLLIANMLLSGNTSQQYLLIFPYCATTSLPGGRKSCNSYGKTAVSKTCCSNVSSWLSQKRNGTNPVRKLLLLRSLQNQKQMSRSGKLESNTCRGVVQTLRRLSEGERRTSSRFLNGCFGFRRSISVPYAYQCCAFIGCDSTRSSAEHEFKKSTGERGRNPKRAEMKCKAEGSRQLLDEMW